MPRGKKTTRRMEIGYHDHDTQKADNKNELSNYRPISQTPSIAKLFERIISVRLKIKKKILLLVVNQVFNKNKGTACNKQARIHKITIF